MQLPRRTRLSAVFVFLFVCLLAGCDASGSDGSCDGREELLIETDRDSYQAGERATLTIENCTGSLIAFRRADFPHYELQKRSGMAWRRADGQGGLSGFDQELQAGESEEVAVPIEPKEEQVESVAGTYRFELSVESFGRSLPEGARYSNTFGITD